jgi:hypothetical protein
MYSGDFVSAEDAVHRAITDLPGRKRSRRRIAFAARLAGKSPDVLRSIKQLAERLGICRRPRCSRGKWRIQAGRFKAPEFGHMSRFLAGR